MRTFFPIEHIIKVAIFGQSKLVAMTKSLDLDKQNWSALNLHY
jgi:hypothetical protein